jgi:hypothetical protein
MSLETGASSRAACRGELDDAGADAEGRRTVGDAGGEERRAALGAARGLELANSALGDRWAAKEASFRKGSRRTAGASLGGTSLILPSLDRDASGAAAPEGDASFGSGKTRGASKAGNVGERDAWFDGAEGRASEPPSREKGSSEAAANERAPCLGIRSRVSHPARASRSSSRRAAGRVAGGAD